MRFFFSILLVCCLYGAGPLLMLQAHAQTIHLKTENYPPFNMIGSGDSIVGISTEIVETLFKRAGVDYTLELLPWQRAFSLALNEQDNAVFSTTRTAQREAKFKWVGPLVENNWVFLAKKSRNISVQNLEEGKDYRVGGYQGDAVALYLTDQGYQMDLTQRDELNARKISRDRIDLWATGHLLGPYYAMQQGVFGLIPVMTFRETIMSIAFNINTDDAIIDRLNAELEAMKREGVVARIQDQYR